MKLKEIKQIQCKEAVKYICKNLDEPDDSPICRKIKKHIQRCPDCATNLANIKKIISLYKKSPTPKLSSSAEERLFKALKIK